MEKVKFIEALDDSEITKEEAEDCEQLIQNLSQDEVYEVLSEAFALERKQHPDEVENFKEWLETLMRDLEKQSSPISLRKFKNVYKEFILDNPERYTEDIDKKIAELVPLIKKQANGFYKRLGLKETAVHKSASIFIENAIRRELSINDWKDTLQEWAYELNILGKEIDEDFLGIDATAERKFEKVSWLSFKDQSIGSMEIRPSTYLEALLIKNDLSHAGKSFPQRLRLAIKNGLIKSERDILDTLLDPVRALQAFEDILAMYIPSENSAIPVLLNKNGVLKRFKMKKKSHYTFSDKNGVTSTITHEELRLMAGISRYRGSGLRFLTPDDEIPVSETGEVILSDNFKLNNEVWGDCVI